MYVEKRRIQSFKICTKKVWVEDWMSDPVKGARSAPKELAMDTIQILGQTKQKWLELEKEIGTPFPEDLVNKCFGRWMQWAKDAPGIPVASLSREVMKVCGMPGPKPLAPKRKSRRPRSSSNEDSNDDDIAARDHGVACQIYSSNMCELPKVHNK